MKALGIVVAVFLMSTTGALAQESNTEQQTQQDAEQEKKICRSEKITGSLTRVRRVCMTQREWSELAENQNRALDRLGRSANQAEGMTSRDNSRGMAGAGGGPF